MEGGRWEERRGGFIYLLGYIEVEGLGGLEALLRIVTLLARADGRRIIFYC